MHALERGVNLLCRLPFKSIPAVSPLQGLPILQRQLERCDKQRVEVQKQYKWRMEAEAMASKAPGVDGIMAGGSPMVESRELSKFKIIFNIQNSNLYGLMCQGDMKLTIM